MRARHVLSVLLLSSCGGAASRDTAQATPAPEPAEPAAVASDEPTPEPDAPPEAPPPVVTAARPAPTPSAPSGLAAGLLAAHNKARAAHCAPPLAWSAKLAATAQKWAESLRDHNCAFEHSRSAYGENLAGGTSGSLDAAAVVEMWYRELDNYDFGRGGFSMDTGHFTQVVWRETTQVGCGMATCRDGMDLFVCNYDPPGNVEGGYKANVKPVGCK